MSRTAAHPPPGPHPDPGQPPGPWDPPSDPPPQHPQPRRQFPRPENLRKSALFPGLDAWYPQETCRH